MNSAIIITETATANNNQGHDKVQTAFSIVQHGGTVDPAGLNED